MKDFITNIFYKIENSIKESEKRVEKIGSPFRFFIVVAIAKLCFVPFVFSDTCTKVPEYFIVTMRLLTSILGFLIVIQEFWPDKCWRFLPLFKYLLLLLCLPYFSIAMAFLSTCSIEWIIDLAMTLFILGILVDWKTYISLIIFSLILGILTIMLIGNPVLFYKNLDGYFILMAYSIANALVVGAIFARHRESIVEDKIITFRAIAETIAHEMRTPLSSINISATGLKRILPVLVDGYKKSAVSSNSLSKLEIDSVLQLPDRMSLTCSGTINTIEIILMQLKDHSWNTIFEPCSIKECVKYAVEEYEFKEEERSLISLNMQEDFYFLGHKYLVIHILYNLLRNSLAFIKAEKKGRISIWTSDVGREFTLHFLDTARGIQKKDLPSIFEHGYSKRPGGSGIGLYYCRKVMEEMSGTISVKSVFGQYCEFILTFKKASSKDLQK